MTPYEELVIVELVASACAMAWVTWRLWNLPPERGTEEWADFKAAMTGDPTRTESEREHDA